MALPIVRKHWFRLLVLDITRSNILYSNSRGSHLNDISSTIIFTSWSSSDVKQWYIHFLQVGNLFARFRKFTLRPLQSYKGNRPVDGLNQKGYSH